MSPESLNYTNLNVSVCAGAGLGGEAVGGEAVGGGVDGWDIYIYIDI